MATEPHNISDLERFRELLKNASSADFDGHTEFHRLTNEQKLMWLSQCAQFFTENNALIKQI